MSHTFYLIFRLAIWYQDYKNFHFSLVARSWNEARMQGQTLEAAFAEKCSSSYLKGCFSFMYYDKYSYFK